MNKGVIHWIIGVVVILLLFALARTCDTGRGIDLSSSDNTTLAGVCNNLKSLVCDTWSGKCQFGSDGNVFLEKYPETTPTPTDYHNPPTQEKPNVTIQFNITSVACSDDSGDIQVICQEKTKCIIIRKNDTEEYASGALLHRGKNDVTIKLLRRYKELVTQNMLNK